MLSGPGYEHRWTKPRHGEAFLKGAKDGEFDLT